MLEKVWFKTESELALQPRPEGPIMEIMEIV